MTILPETTKREVNEMCAEGARQKGFSAHLPGRDGF
jgi:hypothetical protein